MKYKLLYIMLFCIICCSLSSISAVDLNETHQIQIEGNNETLNLNNDNILTTQENYLDTSQDQSISSIEKEDNLENPQNETVLNISSAENELYLGDNTIQSSSSDLNLNEALNSKNPLYGIVDFGSNTINLSIYELKKSGKTKSVFSISETSVTAIYCENNNLTQKGIQKLNSMLKDYNEIMDLVNVKTKYIFATAGMRKLDNCEEVIASVKENLGLEIHLLSGEKEAITSFNAVKDTELTKNDGIVIDLGGGSCEVIDFINKTPITMESMPIGSRSCYDEYVTLMLPNETEISEIQNRVMTELKKLNITNTTQRYDLFGVGGSVRTIKKMLVYLEFIDKNTNHIPISMLDDLLNEFKNNTKENYQKILNVNANRINTFVPGLIITKTIAEYFNITKLHFCKNSVREGILNEIIENETREKSPDNGTFQALQDKINRAEEGAIIYLFNNYTYDASFITTGVNITKSITIEGNGFTIDGLNKARIFNVYTMTVILNNIKFVNGYAENGGAIKFNNELTDSKITNCIFDNNTAEFKGGAILFDSDLVDNIILNLTLTNNNAESGGAIYSQGEIQYNTFTQWTIINNHADHGGGIETIGNLYNNYLNRFLLINNTSTRQAGGIFSRNGLYENDLSHFIFINNSARTGGAISIGSDIDGNNFTKIICINNSAREEGGAIHTLYAVTNNTFNELTFINNSASERGGGISSTERWLDNTMTHVNFINNSADSGGAIWLNVDIFRNKLDTGNFINNSAIDGSAIFINSKSINNTLSNLNFINNPSSNGVIHYRFQSDDKIISSRFLNNTVENYAVLFFNAEGSVYIEDCEFIGNIAGGIVTDIEYSFETRGTVKNCIFGDKNCIEVLYYSNISFINNTELYSYPDGYFLSNYGNIILLNNSLRNVIVNTGNIASKTSIYVLDNKTRLYTPFSLFAYCTDDNENFIVSDIMTFDINGYKLEVSMDYNPIAYVDYEPTQIGTFIISASLSGTLSNCTYYTGTVKNQKQKMVSDIEVTSDENAEILAILPKDATGTIIVWLNDIIYSSTINNGTASLIIPKLESGDYSANVIYNGDENYLTHTQTISINVKTIVFDAYDMTRGWNSDFDYQVRLLDDKGNGIGNKVITFTISGKQYYAMTDNNGFANIKTRLNVGTYQITISSPLLKQDITKTLKIVKRIQNNKNLKAYYNSNQKYKIKIIGDDGNAETKGKNVEVTIDNKKYTYKTDKDGFITINLNKNLKVGKHTLIIKYKGFDVQNVITVKHAITSKKVVNVKKSMKRFVIKAKLKGKTIKNKKIKFKIKGKTYSAKTNKKGIAKITLKKNKFKKGKYPVKVTYLKDTITTYLKIK